MSEVSGTDGVPSAPRTDQAEGTRLPPASWITDGSLVRAVFRLALPTMGAVALQDVYSLVDMFWVGKLGSSAVAAVSLAGILIGVSFTVVIGLSVGCLALVSRHVGTGSRAGGERVAAQSVLLAVALSAATILVGLVFAEDLLRLLGAPEEVVSQGSAYVRIAAVGSLPMYLGIALTSSLRASGDAMTPLVVLLIANVINIALDPILIFGWFGMPALGVAGSACATLLAQIAGLGIVLHVFFVSGHTHFHLRLQHLRPDWPTMWRIIRVGVFSSGEALVRNVSALALVRIIASYGKWSLAAYGIGMRLFFAALMPGIGVGIAAATLVGQNLGAGLPRRSARAAWLATGFFAAIGIGAALLFTGLGEPLVRLFNSEPNVVATGVTFLLFIGVTMPFTSLSAVLSKSLQGAGDTFSPMAITALAMLCLRIPLAYVLSASMGSVTGVWVAAALSNVVQGCAFAFWFGLGRWKTKKV